MRTLKIMLADTYQSVPGEVTGYVAAMAAAAGALIRDVIGGPVKTMAEAAFSGVQREPAAAVFGDADDIRNSQDGDAEAFRRLIERHQGAVGRLMWRFTRDRTEHEELVQQVFVEAYLSLSGYAGKAPFAHWLSRIATRVGYRYWSRLRRHPATLLPDEAWENLAETADNTLDSQQAADLVHRLLAQLPARDRVVLTLRYLEQCDVASTAYRLGWTQTVVRVQTHRALRKLKKLLADQQIELEL